MTISYRRDIDGLRAVAVTSVVAFHVGMPGLGGGFVGVDVFFVISGFLITTLLLDELHQSGSIDLIAFYARRARRLLPAFFLVMASTLALGAIFLLPIDDEQVDLARSAQSAALYFSNLHFARNTGGYFDNSSELLPLLHTWSLSVEEQFYLIWPVILIVCWLIAVRRRWSATACIALTLLVIFATSLAYSQAMSQGGDRAVGLAFFSLPSRGWELGIGAALALALPFIRRSAPRFGSVLAVMGLLAIALSAASFKEGMPFPGAAALLPTAGAAAIIVGGWLAPHSWPTQLLSTRPLVGIGLLSYSWYLWHWPLLAIARAHDLGAADFGRDAAIALASLGLAWLTYAWIEHPIRSRKIRGGWSNGRILAAGAAASLLLIAGAQGLRLHADRLANSSRYERFAQASDDKTWSRTHCHHNNGTCPQGAGIPYRGIVVLWGDSHADQFAGTVHAAVAPYGLALLARDFGGCPPVTDAVVFASTRPIEKCSRFNAGVLAEIKQLAQSGELKGVVLSARWPLYLGRPMPSGRPSPRIIARPGQLPSVESAPAAFHHGVKATIASLHEHNVKLAVIAPAPEFRHDVPKCLVRKSLSQCNIPQAEAKTYRHAALAELTSVFRGTAELRVWDPFTALCGNDICPAERDGLILYHDDGHLTYAASRSIAPHFAQVAAWLADPTSTSSFPADEYPPQR